MQSLGAQPELKNGSFQLLQGHERTELVNYILIVLKRLDFFSIDLVSNNIFNRDIFGVFFW